MMLIYSARRLRCTLLRIDALVFDGAVVSSSLPSLWRSLCLR